MKCSLVVITAGAILWGLAAFAAAEDPPTKPAKENRAEALEQAARAKQAARNVLQQAIEAIDEAIDGSAVRRQAAAPRSANDGSPESVDEILKRIDETNRELVRLKLRKEHVPAAQQPTIHALLDLAYLGLAHDHPRTAHRFLAARVKLVNLTAGDLVLKRGDIELLADGKPLKLEALPERVRHQSFQTRNQHYQIANLTTPEELTVPQGEAASVWLVFGGLPTGSDVPRMVAQLRFGERMAEVDVNQQALAALRLEVERIGPRKCLALLTIGGELSAINAGDLVDTLDKLAARKVARAVLRWKDGASPVDHQLWHWLQQGSMRAGQGGEFHDNYPQYPDFPASIRELHLVQPPGNNSSVSTSYHNGVPLRALVHKTEAEAIEAALEPVYEGLPPDEVLEEIEDGHPLARSAALAHGGGRLPAEYLPEIIAYADHDEPALQKAALIALGEFGEAAAIEKLVAVVRQNRDPLVTVAVESLAGSRFAAAHQALLELLRGDDEPTRRAVVKVLARYPRPIWSDVLYEFAQDRDSPLSVDALRALMAVGHPRLNELLERALRDGSESIRKEVFNLLATRDDPESEELALGYTLKHLERNGPTAEMVQLLQRTKDQRAVPLLLKHLDRENNRSLLIGVLAQIGDQRVAEALVERYPSLKSHEQAVVLNALVQLQSPHFRKLAGQALNSNESSLVSTATQGLIAEGGRESVRLLIEAFENPKNQRGWSYIANALGTLGTPEARTALLRARDSSNASRRNFAVNALQNLRQRSPGYQYVYQAQHSARQGQWKEAATQYGRAVQMDPDLADAWSGRGSALLNLGKKQEAKRDFEKALELDPYNSQAVTGAAIIQILDGEIEKGIQRLEASRERFKHFDQMVFAYNAACVYSRAFEEVQKNEKAADRAEKADRYKKKALEELERAIKAGYRDFSLMRNDPDMKPLHDLPEFKKLVPESDQPNARVGQRIRRERPVVVEAIEVK